MITLVLLGLLLLPFVIVGGSLALFWKSRRRAILRWSGILYITAVPVTLFGIGPYLLAWTLVHAGTRSFDNGLKDTPATYGVQYEDVVFDARDGVKLSGWFIPPTGKSAIVIATHGLFRNRVEVLARMIPLARAGYGALLYDSRSHGISAKSPISLGYHEKNDVIGAMQFVQRRYQDSVEQPRIILMGVSMGAVATLEAAAETRSYSALILDSPFSTLREAIVDHSWLLLKAPRYPFPGLFAFWLQRLAGFDIDRVDSHRALARADPVPLLIISSAGDRRIAAGVASSLYHEAKSTMKKLELFGQDVTHGAAARMYPEAYSALMLNFLSDALTDSGVAGDDFQGIKAPSAAKGSPR